MQWNHMKSFKFTTFYDLEPKVKALVIIQWFFWEIGQFLSEQRAFKKKFFFGHSVQSFTSMNKEQRYQIEAVYYR